MLKSFAVSLTFFVLLLALIEGLFQFCYTEVPTAAPVKITLDNRDRRISAASPKSAKRFIAIFGCSFTFGTGVNDDETYPAHLQRLLPRDHIYNYGVLGGGPHDILHRLQTNSLRAEIPEKQGVAVYAFIDSHIQRAALKLSYAGTWGRRRPVFEMEKGQLVYKGPFTQVHPVKFAIYKILAKSAALRYFHFDFPPGIWDVEVELTADHLLAIKQEFVKSFPGQRFMVLFLPWQSALAPRVIPELQKRGVEWINFDVAEVKKQFNGGKALRLPDGHFSAKTYEFIAQQLANRLAY